MRFGWDNKVVNVGEPIMLHDIEIHILDKDDNTHIRTIKDSWHVEFDKRAYRSNVDDWRAKYLLESKEYVQTDEKILIPRCNIKQITLKNVNERYEQPTTKLIGIRNWGFEEWFPFCAMSALCSSITTLLGYLIYDVIHKV